MRATLAAASALIAAAIFWRARLVAFAGNTFSVSAGDASSAAPSDPESDYTPPDYTETAMAAVQQTYNRITGTPASGMRTSAAGLDHLQDFERVRLTPYRLGDGGQTIGWGRFYPDSGPPPPAAITMQQADAWFAEDVQSRAERWVKAYVTVPLTQSQFDGLVSMAYNLSPKSFRTIAEAVNAGEDPEAAALRFVRAGTNLEKGLRRRRDSELAIYRSEGIATA